MRFRTRIRGVGERGCCAVKKSILRVAALVALMAAGIAPAHAQEYPGTTTSTTAGPTSEVQNVGVKIEGSFFINEACLFQVGSTVTVTFNGQFVQVQVVGEDTCVRQRVEISTVNQTQALAAQGAMLAATGLKLPARTAQAAQVRITIDGRPFSGQITNNRIAVSGVGLNGQPRTVTTVFSVADPAGGAPSPSAGGPTAFGRTGARAAMWAGVAALLVLLGLALYRLGERRRRYNA